jgi:excisionase family DNA binding protein
MEAGSSTALTTVDAARILQVSPDTVRRHADSGRIPCWRTPGGHRRFKLDIVEAFKAAA